MLVNKSNEKVISREEELADTGFRRMRGLMFRGRFRKPLLFILPKETRLGASIHMLFVFFSIDVVYLDRNWKVVDLYENVRPFTLNIAPKVPVRYFIELPAGSVRKYGIRKGSRIEKR